VQVGLSSQVDSRWWQALFEVGPSAVLDGISALQAAGLRTIDSDLIHVAVPKSVTPHGCRGVRVHETRRYRLADISTSGIPRMRPATAAVHGALWARTNSEAALIIVASVQQGLVSVPDLAAAVAEVKRDKRRGLLRGLLWDVSDGIESFSELQFSKMLLEYGLPEPSRQLVVRTPSGRVRFDNVWDRYQVLVEIDGAQHLDAASSVRDAFKQNEVAIDGMAVLRIPNFALRADPVPFLRQLGEALTARGWRRNGNVRLTRR
jgi:hypothetical protein